jgi:peptidylprolyl isomerase
MKYILAAGTLLLTSALALPSSAQEGEEQVTPASVVADASPGEWVIIAPADLLVMELAPGAQGNPRTVVIQLLPPPFSQPWVENIRTLARAHWWDGTSVYRVVDNWVAQWGDVTEDKALPDIASPDAGYVVRDPGLVGRMQQRFRRPRVEDAADRLQSLIDREKPIFQDVRDNPPGNPDQYAAMTGFEDGWPLATDATSTFPIHCYSHVGVARDIETTGTGSELYAVIGHAPRQLDRNIAVVGRVIEGIEHLSTLPRGTGGAGVYENRAEDTPILSVRLASELADPPAFEYLGTDSESFARYAAVRANRNDPFYSVSAGGVDICNVAVPIRRAE